MIMSTELPRTAEMGYQGVGMLKRPHSCHQGCDAKINRFVIHPMVGGGDTLPWRVEVNQIKAAGVTLTAALMRGFEMLGELGRGTNPKEAARHLFWRYEPGGRGSNPEITAWQQAITALEREL